MNDLGHFLFGIRTPLSVFGMFGLFMVGWAARGLFDRVRRQRDTPGEAWRNVPE